MGSANNLVCFLLLMAPPSLAAVGMCRLSQLEVRLRAAEYGESLRAFDNIVL